MARRSALWLAMLAACSSEPSAPLDASVPKDGGPPTWEGMQLLFGQRCTFSSCHSARAAGGLVLLPESAYANLLAPSTQVPAMLRVRPGDPDASYLLRKIDGTMSALAACATPTVCGTSMPQSDEIMSASVRAVVRAWIADGAPGPRDE
jgi:hypothetical protein